MTQSKFKFIYLPAAAELVGVQRSQISEWVNQGRLKPISGEGQQMVFRTADIERLAEELGLANPAAAPEALADNVEGSATPKKARRPRDAVQKVGLRVASLKKWLDVTDAEAREWALAQEKLSHPAIRRQLAAIVDKLNYLQRQLEDLGLRIYILHLAQRWATIAQRRVKLMLRSVLLYLSRNKMMYRIVMSVALFRRMALRFVAGEKLDDAVAVVRALNARGIAASLDHLGENVNDAAATEKATADYIAALEAIAANKLHSGISVKLTQLGLDISDDLTVQNMRKVLDRARDLGNIFVRVDMEGSDYTERTVNIVECLYGQYGYKNVGTVIQAYLYRSESDIEELNRKHIHVRLCKGAYKEGSRIAYPVKEQLDANYVNLSRLLLTHGDFPSLATHDPKMIGAVLDYIGEKGIDPSRFEFQMLYGIRRDEQERLARDGYNMRVYVPYGVDWYPYFMRRLAERPANIVFFLTGLVKG